MSVTRRGFGRPRKRYAVRCCCQPMKVLGYLDLPADLRHGSRVQLYRPPRVSVMTSYEPPATIPAPEWAEIREFYSYATGRRVVELAVYSDDRPVEFWAGLPNFTPIDAQDHHTG